MSDPYQVLNLARSADEAEIRRRYLELVRQFPPDREPEKFAAIREAYESVRDPLQRLRNRLFDWKCDDTLEAVEADLLGKLRGVRIPASVLLELADLP